MLVLAVKCVGAVKEDLLEVMVNVGQIGCQLVC